LARGCVSAIDSNGRTIWIADAHRDNGKRFVVDAEEKLTAFVELESAIYPATVELSLLSNRLTLEYDREHGTQNLFDCSDLPEKMGL
jgi:hypothetical protein